MFRVSGSGFTLSKVESRKASLRILLSGVLQGDVVDHKARVVSGAYEKKSC